MKVYLTLMEDPEGCGENHASIHATWEGAGAVSLTMYKHAYCGLYDDEEDLDALSVEEAIEDLEEEEKFGHLREMEIQP